MLQAKGVSPGIAIGKAFVLEDDELYIPDRWIQKDELSSEMERLYGSIVQSKTELKSLQQEIQHNIGKQESLIFDAHLAILEDPSFMAEVQQMMERQFKSAEAAVKDTVEKFVEMFALLDNDYMKERAADIRDVGYRLLKHLLEVEDEVELPTEPYILVTRELKPSQFAQLESTYLIGIWTMEGGTTSHAAIMARAMGIPFVIGGAVDFHQVKTGDELIVDGGAGTVLLLPSELQLEEYKERKLAMLLQWEELQSIIDSPSVTADGYELELSANISSIKEIDHALKNGAAGVGLFRTEFLYMDRSSLPNEEEQLAVYREAASKLNGLPLIIRTLDIGGDKQLEYLELPQEDNPFLGYRAIRISLDREELFLTQLRAILRASADGCVKIMYPMITSIEEVRQANALLEQAKRELDAEGQPYRADIEVGIMIEVPAAALIADSLAREVQFFSIGTNDLVQYVLAVDRMNEHIAHLYNPYQPAIVRLLQQIVNGAKQEDIPVSVCGELAGDPYYLPLWLGMGIHKLSMSVQSLLRVKQKILSRNAGEDAALLKQALQCATSDELCDLLGVRL